MGGSKTQSILNFAVNKVQTSKPNGKTGSKESSSSSVSNESVCASSRNTVSVIDKYPDDQSRNDKPYSLSDQSEICDNGTDQSERRVPDQSERNSLHTDQSDLREDNYSEASPAAASHRKSEKNWASENLIEELGR